MRKLSPLLIALLVLACGPTSPPRKDSTTCTPGNTGAGSCPAGQVCGFFGCEPSGGKDNTGQAQQASVSVETSCSGLPAAPYSGLTETLPFYEPTLDGSMTPDNGHGWGVMVLPPSGTTIKGVAVVVHPGAWNDACCLPAGSVCSGDASPNDSATTDTRRGLASLGYVTFAPCHRSPSAGVWPAQVSDVICAQRYMADFAAGNACAVNVCADGSACSVDSDCAGHGLSSAVQNNAFLLGASSGAHLATMAAWASFSGIEDGKCPRSGTRPSVAGVVAWSGVYDLDSLYGAGGFGAQAVAALMGSVNTTSGRLAASPISYVSGSHPPSFFWACASDPSPVKGAQTTEEGAYASDAGDGYVTDDVTACMLHAPSLWNTSATGLGCTVRDTFLPNPM